MRPSDQPAGNGPQPPRQPGSAVDGFVLPHVQPRQTPPVNQSSSVVRPVVNTSASLGQTGGVVDSMVRPQRPVHQPHQPETHFDHQLPAPAAHELLPEHINLDDQPKQAVPKKHSIWKWLGVIVGLLVVLALVAAGLAYRWYQDQLLPVSGKADAQTERLTIEPGSTPKMIGDLLQSKGVIRNADAFVLYTHLSETKGRLQAGSYVLQSSSSVEEIVDHLVSGKVDEFEVTFLPGATVADYKKSLAKLGYEQSEIEAAFAKTYNHPVMAGKPAGTDLEGYVFGETYRFATSATVEQILTRSFDELQSQVIKYDLVNAYKKQGLNLYEGITLASIIQREVATPADMRQVSQIFHLRLNTNMSLGADATFVYAAKKVGKTPTVDFDSPYNTRTHKGLPPGPISSPGSQALQAAGSPAPGDYVFFISGDDGRSHFAHTMAEHDANTRKYCQKNCALF